MNTAARKPPLRLIARLRGALGGQAGWGGVLIQIAFVIVLVGIGYEIVANARANLQAQRIASGFGFLSNTAGFGVSQVLIPYSESDSYARVFLVGLMNTLVVSIIGIVFASGDDLIIRRVAHRLQLADGVAVLRAEHSHADGS